MRLSGEILPDKRQLAPRYKRLGEGAISMKGTIFYAGGGKGGGKSMVSLALVQFIGMKCRERKKNLAGTPKIPRKRMINDGEPDGKNSLQRSKF